MVSGGLADLAGDSTASGARSDSVCFSAASRKNGDRVNPERPLAPTPAAAVVTLMLTRIACPNCGHIGAANAASLPRVLICSQCGHGAFIKSGRPARSPSVARDEQAALRAAWERYEAAGEPAAPWP
jgi:hypothetical protein